MSKTIFIYLAALVVLPFAGCGGHHGEVTPVQLDNGKKWTANPETTQGIANMTALVNAFQAGQNEAGYDQLAGQLEDEFQLIFKNCTMKGEGHEQLHNYLLPMKELMEKLKTGTVDRRQKSLEAVGQYLATYSNYFE